MTKLRIYSITFLLAVAAGLAIGLLSRLARGVAAGTPEVEVRRAN